MEGYITRYFLSHECLGEMQVSKEQFIKAEKAAGFHSKLGPDHCATGGFGGAGLQGRVEITKIKEGECDIG